MRGIADDSPAIPVSMRLGGSKRRATRTLATAMDALSALCSNDGGAGSASGPTSERQAATG